MEAMSLTEILAFDDSGLAGELFGPLNAHLELVADASGAEFSTRGTELAVTSSDPGMREILLRLFTQAYALLKSGSKLRGED